MHSYQPPDVADCIFEPRAAARVIVNRVIAVLFVATLLSLTACGPENEIENALAELTRIRQEKGKELSEYFEHVRNTVESVQEDEEIVDAFVELADIFGGRTAERSVSRIERTIIDRYLTDYQIFLDLHFVNARGDVFYSVLKQENLFRNIFDDELGVSRLATELRERPDATTVDFLFPGFGTEPSAFFAQPIRHEGEHRGWIVFQFASSRLSEIFTYEPALGRTGEVFLVNRDHFLLTNAYNLPESAILRRHLSAENIEGKFAEREGEKVVVDYRGYEALTSFRVHTIMGFEWLLIAKIDRDEIVTRQYLDDPERYHEQIRAWLRTTDREYADVSPPEDRNVQVHLDDFRRIDTPLVLYTPGVATCTSVIVTLPGRFAYMAHVSPYDRMYGGSRTDLVRTILRRVLDFEIADKEMREVEVAIVTPSIRYSERLLDELVDAGVFLSQITLMKNPDARGADVRFDFATNETYVTWYYGSDYEERHVQLKSESPTIGAIMERFLPE